MSVRKSAVGGDEVSAPADPSGRTTRAAAAALDNLCDDDSEDFCSYCGLRGQLVVCEASGCRRVYHQSCLTFSPSTLQIFFCPAHFCALCGKPDRQIQALSDTELVRCVSCPTAYCPGHVPAAGVSAAANASAPPPPLADDFFMTLLSAGPSRSAAVAACPEPAMDVAPEQPPATAPQTPGVAAESGDGGDGGGTTGQKRKRPHRRTERETLVAAALAAPGTRGGDEGDGDEPGDGGPEGGVPGGAGNSFDGAAAVPGRKAGRSTQSRLSDRDAKAAAGGSRGGRFKCSTCSGGGGARLHLARVLERSWSAVVNVSAPRVSLAALAPVTDASAIPVYLAAGLSRRSLGLPDKDKEESAAADEDVRMCPASSPVVAAAASDGHAGGGGNDAVDTTPLGSTQAESGAATTSGSVRRSRNPQRALLRRFIESTDTVHAAAVLAGARELDALPATPCCLDDLLACIRAGKYSDTVAFVADVDAMLSVIRTVGRSSGRSAIAQLPRHDRIASGDASESRDFASPGNSYIDAAAALAADAGAVAAAGAALLGEESSAAAVAASLDAWVLGAEHVGQLMKDAALDQSKSAFAGAKPPALWSAASSAAPSPSADVPIDTLELPRPSLGGDAVDSMLQAASLSVSEAAARIFAAKAMCLRPELSRCAPRVPVGRLVDSDRKSIAAWVALLANPTVSGRDGAVERLKNMTASAMRGRRDPILLGFGPASERWAASRPLPALQPTCDDGEADRRTPVKSSAPADSLGAGSASAATRATMPRGRLATALCSTLAPTAAGRRNAGTGAEESSFDPAFARWVRRHLRRAAAQPALAPGEPGSAAAPPPEDPKTAAFRRKAAAAMQWSGEIVRQPSQVTQPPAPDQLKQQLASPSGPPGKVASSARLSASLGAAPIPAQPGRQDEVRSLAPPPMVAAAPDDVIPWASLLGTLLPASRNTGGMGGSCVSAEAESLASVLPFLQGSVAGLARQASAESGAPNASPSSDTSALAVLICALGAQVQSLRAELRVSQAQLLSAGQQIQALAAESEDGETPEGGFPYAPPRRSPRLSATEARIAPPDLPDGSYSSYGAFRGRMSAPELDAVAVLTELGPADVDGDLRQLGALLPPSAEETAALIEAASGHARRTVVAVGELRAAWAASRRAMFSIPAPAASADARLCVPPAGDAPAVAYWASGDGGGEEAAEAASSSQCVTLGEGRFALECALSNRGLRARLAQAEAALAAERLRR